jgi:hypothetical protein
LACFQNLKFSRERASADEIAGSKCYEEFEEIVGDGKYSRKQSLTLMKWGFRK